jgi:hypothetical protein
LSMSVVRKADVMTGPGTGTENRGDLCSQLAF